MSRRFPLEGLLRVRELAQERAAATLERANGMRRQAERAVESEYDAIGGLDFAGGEWAATAASRTSGQTRAVEAAQELTQAQGEAERAAQDWTAARMGAAMIDKLRERHYAEVVVEDLRAEQLVLDEAALRRQTEELA